MGSNGGGVSGGSGGDGDGGTFHLPKIFPGTRK